MPGKLLQLIAPVSMSVLRLTGPARYGAQKLTAFYLGNGRNLNFLSDLFFRERVTETSDRPFYPFSLRRMLRATAEADLVLAEVPPLWAPLLPRAGTIRFPAWIRQQLLLPQTPREKGWLLPREIERNTQRLIRKHGYRIELTDDPTAKQLFFRQFYAPYVNARFGAGSFVDREDVFMQRSRGQKLVFLLDATAQRVAGMLLRRRGATVRFGRYGAITDPPPQGASQVLHTLVIHHCYEQGVRQVVLGDSRPCLTDGVTCYKSRLGATVTSTMFPTPELCIEVRRPSDAIRACLAEQPLLAIRRGEPVVVSAEGNL